MFPGGDCVFPQHRQGAGDALLSQATVPADAATEPGDLRSIREHLDLPARFGLGDQQQRGVGADVDRREGQGFGVGPHDGEFTLPR